MVDLEMRRHDDPDVNLNDGDVMDSLVPDVCAAGQVCYEDDDEHGEPRLIDAVVLRFKSRPGEKPQSIAFMSRDACEKLCMGIMLQADRVWPSEKAQGAQN